MITPTGRVSRKQLCQRKGRVNFLNSHVSFFEVKLRGKTSDTSAGLSGFSSRRHVNANTMSYSADMLLT